MDCGDGVHTLVGGVVVGGTGLSVLTREPLRRPATWIEVGVVTIAVIVLWRGSVDDEGDAGPGFRFAGAVIQGTHPPC
jgi:hypothetical protein